MPLLQRLGLPAATADVVAFVLALLTVTFLHLVVGEMAPKSWAISHPERNGRMASFLIIEPHSSYPPFRAGNIPEIADFNVLAQERGHRVGTALMDEAERRVAENSSVAGLGVGLYADYGTAQRMYVRRGYLPDGAGVVLDGVSAPPGTLICLDDDPVLMFTKVLHDEARV